MRYAQDHRAEARRTIRLEAQADYMPRHSSGRWWENFDVRAVDVGGGGLQVVTTVPMQVGARLRLIVEPAESAESAPFTVQGEIVWIREPAIPWLGMYRAGVAFQPALQTGLDRFLERCGTVMAASAAV